MKKIISAITFMLLVSCSSEQVIRTQYTAADLDFSKLKAGRYVFYGTDNLDISAF